ncbi:MAG: hypothetical protein FWE03_02695 [Firmicutes bacterium]|nr:hypothetical protein [Bacillota bacterium]
MTNVEKLIIQIGELVATEIDQIKDINYLDDKNIELDSFLMTLKCGQKYSVEIKRI